MPLVLSGTSGVLDNSGAFIAGTAVASTSGTSIDFTGIPSWVKRVTVCFNGVSLNGSAVITLQIGTSSGIETTGYNGSNFFVNSGGSSGSSVTSGVQFYGTGGASNLNYGTVVFTLLGSNTWTIQGGVSTATFSANATVYGGKALSGTLDRVRITTSNGTDAFDAGSINILYE
jgi:hypothetical protein